MVNKKVLWTFLGITFGLTISLVVAARLLGFTLVGAPAFMSQMVVLICMFIPTLSAVIAQKFIAGGTLRELGFKLGPLSMYVKAYGIIVLIFAINYGFTWIFITKPDFTLASFINQFISVVPGLSLPMPAAGMVALMAGITFIGAPIFNMIPSLGEEIGWRGFLLPNLEPLGETKALVLSGMIWALWHTPMILVLGFTYGMQAWPGVILHFVTVTGLGIWMGYIWFRTRSTVLAGFMHATFNANAYGVWTLLFISSDRLVIGAAGLIGASLCLTLGIVTLYKVRSNRPD